MQKLNKIEEARKILDGFENDDSCRSIMIKINKDAGVVWSGLNYNVKTDDENLSRYDRVISRLAEEYDVDFAIASSLIHRIQCVIDGGIDDNILVINNNVYVNSSFNFFHSIDALKLRQPLVKSMGTTIHDVIDGRIMHVIKMTK